jgi:hypothetical protein
VHLSATWWRLPHPDVVPAFFALEGPMTKLAKRGRKGGDQAQLAAAGRTLSTALLLQFLIHEVLLSSQSVMYADEWASIRPCSRHSFFPIEYC